jgi:hypothetical protein
LAIATGTGNSANEIPISPRPNRFSGSFASRLSGDRPLVDGESVEFLVYGIAPPSAELTHQVSILL